MINTLLTIIGIVATIAVGTLGIRYALKFRQRVRLTYIQEDCIALFRSIVKNMPEIDILYEKKEIDPSLMMLKGSFINDGSEDIDKLIIHKPLAIELPPAYKWLQAKVVDTSPGVKVEREIKNQTTLEFKWDLLKKNEFFRFDTLIQAPTDQNKTTEGKEKEEERAQKLLSKLISFPHRITNLEKIDKKDLVDFRAPMGVKRTIVLMVFILLSGLSLVLYPILKPPLKIQYLLSTANGKTFEVSLSPQNDNTIKVKGIKEPFSERLKPEEIFSSYTLTPIVVSVKEIFYISFVYGIILLVGSAVFLIAYYVMRKREKKLAVLMKLRD